MKMYFSWNDWLNDALTFSSLSLNYSIVTPTDKVNHISLTSMCNHFVRQNLDLILKRHEAFLTVEIAIGIRHPASNPLTINLGHFDSHNAFVSSFSVLIVPAFISI